MIAHLFPIAQRARSLAAASSLTICGLAALGLGGSISAQQTVIVQGGGTALDRAVQAASPGDVLVVRAGTYLPVVVRRGITVLCNAGVQLTTFSLPPVGPTLSFELIPTGEVATWRGGELAASAGGPSILSMTNAPGAIHVEGLTTRQLRIAGADQVTMADTTIATPSQQVAGTIVDIADANVSFLRCSIRGGIIGEQAAGTFLAARSDIAIAQSVIDNLGAIPGLFAPAIAFDQSNVSIQGAMTVISRQVRTGVGPTIAGNGGSLTLDPAVVLRGAGGPLISGVVPTMQKVAFVEATSSPVSSSTSLRTIAAPGNLVATVIGLHGPRVTSRFGTLWIQAPITLDVSVAPSSGGVTVPYTLPAAAFGVPIVFQAVGIDLTANSIRLGAPAVTVGL